MNSIDYLYLRKIIRKLIIEAIDEETDMPFEDTLLPGDDDDVKERNKDANILGGGDMTNEPAREKYLKNKDSKRSKKKKAKLHSREETEENTGDEHQMVGHIGPLGASGNGPGDKPFDQGPLKSKNAMGDEYDE